MTLSALSDKLFVGGEIAVTRGVIMKLDTSDFSLQWSYKFASPKMYGINMIKNRIDNDKLYGLAISTDNARLYMFILEDQGSSIFTSPLE